MMFGQHRAAELLLKIEDVSMCVHSKGRLYVMWKITITGYKHQCLCKSLILIGDWCGYTSF